MQNRNVIKIFAILFAIVCLYQLSFTWVADKVEEDAIEYANNFPEDQKQDKVKFYLDSISGEEVYNILIASYTYNQLSKEK